MDTNVVVSALLFTGRTSLLVAAWQQGVFVPVVSKPVVEEYLRVLAYPKFKLTSGEIQRAIGELLPHADTVTVRHRVRAVRRDAEDDKFLECALAGRATHVVSGDRHLLGLPAFRRVRIVSVAEFMPLVTGPS